MSYEDQELQEGSTGADGDGSDGSGEGADDLTMALSGGGETSFVSEGKQPLSKGTMVVAGLLIACGAVTYFMYVRTGPAEAAANPEQAKNEQIVGSFLGDPNRAKGWKELIESTDKVVQQFKKEIPQVLKLPGNPFEKNKPMPTGDQEAQREKERVEKQKLAAKEAASNELKLQTIIHRDPKKAACMINNMMYRKGQKITLGEGKPTFTVDEIRPDAVTVSTPVGKDGKDSVKFDLAMKH
jgi:hypothetical protein